VPAGQGEVVEADGDEALLALLVAFGCNVAHFFDASEREVAVAGGVAFDGVHDLAVGAEDDQGGIAANVVALAQVLDVVAFGLFDLVFAVVDGFVNAAAQ